jgi:hypothetical protein
LRLCPTEFDRYVLTLGIADLIQALTESSYCGVKPSGDPLLRNPITGIAACCARAVSGHATTVLLKSLMNSRRLMGFTPWPRTTLVKV